MKNMEQLKMLLGICAEVMDTTPEKIIGKERFRKTVVARQIYCYISRRFLNYNLGEIGKSINKDHTTVIHSTRFVTNMLEMDDPIISIPYGKIMEKLKENNYTEIKLSIMVNDIINPNIIINDIQNRYDCIITPIY
jgi:chromosomal replication initiation ATPase DnaA